jgi:hypothetical protein
MARVKKLNRSKRKGIVAAFVALCLVFILAMAAITLDGGGLLDRRRQAQATADSAAMAAACVIYANFPTANGLDPSGAAAQAAFDQAASNGYTNDRVTSTVVVNIPPLSGIYTGLPGFAEVLITYQQPRYFSTIWGTSTIPVTSRAVARGSWIPGGQGVIVLDYTGKAALNSQGNGYFTDTSGPIIVNSNNPDAVVDGGNGTLIGQQFFITGGAISNGGGGLVTQPVPGQIFEGVHPTPDPLAYLPEPSVPPAGSITSVPDPLQPGGQIYTLTPGRFTQGQIPNFGQKDTVIFGQASLSAGLPADQQGVYYLDNAGFSSQGATIKMDPLSTGGMLLYNAPSGSDQGASINITGNANGSVTMNALASGPYEGIAIWQDRAATQSMSISGNGQFTISGTVYAANALLTATGNGATTSSYVDTSGNVVQGSTQLGSQFITLDLNLSGNGNIHLGYPGLSGHDRLLTLVE